MKSVIIITNNPEVCEKYQSYKVIYKRTAIDVLTQARDMIHLGHRLLNHPLAGSIKPNETPYRSLILSSDFAVLDYTSLKHIETALSKYKQFYKNCDTPDWPYSVLKDFRILDMILLKNGLEAICEIEL